MLVLLLVLALRVLVLELQEVTVLVHQLLVTTLVPLRLDTVTTNLVPLHRDTVTTNLVPLHRDTVTINLVPLHLVMEINPDQPPQTLTDHNLVMTTPHLATMAHLVIMVLVLLVPPQLVLLVLLPTDPQTKVPTVLTAPN